MALQMDFESESGATGNFWQINNFTISAKEKLCMMSIELYKDDDAYKQGKTALSSRTYNLNGPLYPFNAGAFDALAEGASPADAIYGLLLTVFGADWIGATIVLDEDYGSES